MTASLFETNIAATSDRWGRRQAVRASAGSGKTYQLTGHYLRVFLNGAEPSTILATTFTRKAAGEILGRVLTRLSQACDCDEKLDALATELELAGIDREHARKQLVKLCRALHQVSISTIDGFFARLLSSYRYDLGLPVSYSTVDKDSPENALIRAEAIRCLLEQNEREQLIGLLDGLQQGAFHRGIAANLNERLNETHELFELTEADVWMTERPAGQVLSDAELELALQRIEALAGNYTARLSNTLLSDAQKARQGQWPGLLKSGLVLKIIQGATFYGKEIPEEIQQAYEPLNRHVTAVVLGRLYGQTRALLALLQCYHQEYTQLRRRDRVYRFHDIPLMLANLLPGQESGEVAHRLDTRIDCLLLDEFQDTDPRQYAVLKAFASAIHDGDPAAGLLFCVGDLKQSIYGWRGAVPQIFDRFGDDFSSVQWTENNHSYRSSQIVLDSVNRLFDNIKTNEILQHKNPGAALRWHPRFGEHRSQRDLPGYVEVVESTVEAGDDESEALDGESGISEAAEGETAPRDAHLEFCARRIQELALQSPNASIGVLMRSNAAASQLIFLLNRLGVEASAEGGSPIIDDPAVGVVLSALRFADHPSDSAALFHVMNSPLAPSLKLVGSNPLTGPEAALHIRRQLAYHGYAATIAGWAGKLTPTCDKRGAHRLAQLIDLADGYSGSPASRPGEFVDYVETQGVEEPSPSKIRVMTIHRSKGLEFDIVVLPQLDSGLAQRSGFNLIYRRDPATLRITAVSICPGEEVRALDPELQAIHGEHLQAEIEEALCLLYVAMTRPRHALHIIVPPLKIGKSGKPGKTKFSLASIVRDGLRGMTLEEGDSASAEPPAGQRVLYKQGDSLWFQKMKQIPAAPVPPARQPARRTLELDGLPTKAWTKVTPSASTAGEKKTAREILGLDDADARLRGSVLHAYLARCSWLDEPLPEEGPLVAIARAIWPAATDEQRQECLQSYRALLVNPVVTPLLTRPAVQSGQDLLLWREQPFALLLDGSFVSGVFDRVVITREGEKPVHAELIDYKTGALSPIYVEQIKIYRQALCSMLGLQPAHVAAKLIYTDQGVVVKVTQ